QTVLVTQAARHQQFAEFARLDHLEDTGNLATATALGAVLDDTVVALGGFDGDTAFVDVVTARLLDVDVLARLAGPDGHQRVPVVRSGDRDGVEVLVLQGLADILDNLRLFTPFGGGLEPAGVSARVRIDQVGDLDSVHACPFPDMSTAAAVQTGDRNVDGVIGTQTTPGAFGSRDRDRSSRSQGTHQDCAAS